ncbi:hypothetical protein GCM10012283_30340 [Phycicoccus endophyticus]|nr:hypothetical protein GCM10012283_30340 [Phycicoccus endophyticus]
MNPRRRLRRISATPSQSSSIVTATRAAVGQWMLPAMADTLGFSGTCGAAPRDPVAAPVAREDLRRPLGAAA